MTVYNRPPSILGGGLDRCLAKLQDTSLGANDLKSHIYTILEGKDFHRESYLAALLRNPNFSCHLLDDKTVLQLLQSTDEGVIMALAQAKNLSITYQKILAEHSCTAAVILLAKRNDLSDIIMHQLAHHSDERVRKAIGE